MQNEQQKLNYSFILQFNMALNESVADSEIKISLIRNKAKLTHQQKSTRISIVRASMVQEKTTSAKTITSIANTMIGSTVIVYPVLFIQDGLMSSFLMMLAVGLVQYWTCRILCYHNKPDQLDVNDTVLRILGRKWYLANLITNVVLLYVVCVIYFLIISTNFFQLTTALLQTFTDYHTPTAAIYFKTYSFQWAGIIAMIICFPSLLLRKLDLLLKFLKITAYGVFCYMGFVLIIALKNVIMKQVLWEKYTLFSSDFSNVAGAFALSFIIHPVISPILKKNQHQDKNNRDLFFGYILTGFIYAFVGLVGALACGKVVIEAQKYNTIFDCIPKSDLPEFVVAKLVQTLILLQNMSVFPVLSFLTRKQFLQLFWKQNSPKYASYAFTLSLVIASLLVQILNLNLTAVISFDGAIVGFLMVYLIPLYMHLKCVYHSFTAQENQKRKQQLNSSQQDSLLSDTEVVDEDLKCVEDHTKNVPKDIVLYTVILVFGVAMGAFKIYNFVVGS